MKRGMILVVMGVLVVGMLPLPALAGPGKPGNGASSGEHYSLNIIGVAKDKSPNMNQGAGDVIFVPLDGATAIYLSEGPFAVLDKNGTDGEAKFQLPDPGLDAYVVGDKGDADTLSDYTVYVRPVGKPGGWSTITTCADLIDPAYGFLDLLPDDVVRTIVKNELDQFGGYASIEQVGKAITERKKGKSSFTNVTAELLTIVFLVELYDAEGNLIDTVYIRVPIFDDRLENEYWDYDNDGLKILQVRFYPGVQTDVSEKDVNLPPIP